MSEAKTDTSGADSTSASGEANQEQSKVDAVSYETYRKTVAAEKKAKADREELARKLKAYEEKEQQEQGKYAELVEALRKQVAEKEELAKTVVHNYARKSIQSEFREELLRQGCQDIDLGIQAAASKFSEIEVDPENDFAVNKQDLKVVVESIAKKHPMLFKKTAPKMHDATPGNAGGSNQGFDLSKMKPEDYKKLLAMKLAKK